MMKSFIVLFGMSLLVFAYCKQSNNEPYAPPGANTKVDELEKLTEAGVQGHEASIQSNRMPLIGTEWKLDKMVDGNGELRAPLPEGNDYYTIFFDSDTSYDGTSTVNEIHAIYNIDFENSTFAVRQFAETRISEWGDGDWYCDKLVETTHFSLNDDELVFYCGESGDYLLYRPIGAEINLDVKGAIVGYHKQPDESDDKIFFGLYIVTERNDSLLSCNIPYESLGLLLGPSIYTRTPYGSYPLNSNQQVLFRYRNAEKSETVELFEMDKEKTQPTFDGSHFKQAFITKINHLTIK